MAHKPTHAAPRAARHPGSSAPHPGAFPAPRRGPLAHVIVQDVRPSTPHGYPAKAVVGEHIPVTASIFRDGHDTLAARAVLHKGDGVVAVGALTHLGNDVWSGFVEAGEIGRHELVVEAWTDRYATWAHKATVKLAAHTDVQVEIAEAQSLLSEWASRAGEGSGAEAGDGGPVARALAALGDQGAYDADRLKPALSGAVANTLAGPLLARDLSAGRARPYMGRPPEGCRRRLVRAVPAQLWRPAGCGRADPPPGRPGLRCPVHPPCPPHRPQFSQGQGQLTGCRPG